MRSLSAKARPPYTNRDNHPAKHSQGDSQADQFVTYKADMVALSMSMVASPGAEELAKQLKVDISDTGFFEALYSKFKTVETKKAGVFVAGTATSPADIPTSLNRAGFAASNLDMLLSKGSVEKKFPTAEIDNDKCTLCELCVTACPFGAIDVVPVENPGVKMVVDPVSCLGCGQCVSTCPAAAIGVDYYEEELIQKQLEGLLYDAQESPDPLIVTFACWECAYSATDASGMAVQTLTGKSKIIPGSYDSKKNLFKLEEPKIISIISPS